MIDPYKSFEGVIVPMASPFHENGEIDVTAAGKLIQYLHKNNCIPFIMGTTGEATSIAVKDRENLVKALINNRKEGVPLISGIMGLSFHDTIEEANKYFSLGIDSVVLTLPNYYSLSHRQMYEYFKTVSEKIDGNIILYNIPKTIHMSLPVEIVDELSQINNIIGIKDSEYDEGRLVLSLLKWKERKDFFHLTGVNKLMVRGLELGSRGMVPSTANFEPRIYVELFRLCKEGNFENASESLNRTQELCDIYQKNCSLGESLAALKVILSYMGLCKPEVCTPLTKIPNKEANIIIENYKNTVENEV